MFIRVIWTNTIRNSSRQTHRNECSIRNQQKRKGNVWVSLRSSARSIERWTKKRLPFFTFINRSSVSVFSVCSRYVTCTAPNGIAGMLRLPRGVAPVHCELIRWCAYSCEQWTTLVLLLFLLNIKSMCKASTVHCTM